MNRFRRRDGYVGTRIREVDAIVVGHAPARYNSELHGGSESTGSKNLRQDEPQSDGPRRKTLPRDESRRRSKGDRLVAECT